MTAIALRKKLVNYIQTADSKKIKAVYTLLESEIDIENDYTDEFKQELDNRFKEYQNGTMKLIDFETFKKRTAKILSSKK